MNLLRFFTLVLLVCVIAVVFAQRCEAEVTVIGEIPQIKQAVVLDGEISEDVWSQSLTIPIRYETRPGENIAAPVDTQVYLFEDGENLLVAFKAIDHDPRKIRAYLSDRDKIAASDLVAIKLDTFNDSRKAFQFFVNPLGIQADTVIDEHTGNSDISWDAIWYSAGKLTDDGFTVELKIPFKALRFEDSKDIKTWGIELTRIWRRDVMHRLSNQPIDRNISCSLCQLNKVVGFKSVEAPQNLTIIPSLTVVKSDTRDLENETGWQTGDAEERGSLDLRWGLNHNSFVNVTVNPDFSQVEADAVQLDINNLSVLSLEEKRPFFLDGLDYFNNWSRLVYTRVFEEPEYGVKYTGKTDKHSFGLINLKDKHTNFLVPFSQGSFFERNNNSESDNTVFRYRYDLGESSNVGMTMTYRDGEGYSNRVAGVDGKHWFSKTDYFKYQAFWSEGNYPQELVDKYSDTERFGDIPLVKSDMSDSAYSFNYTHLSRDWYWFATYHHFNKDFRADSGFMSFSNWKRKAVGTTRKWYADNGTWWKHFSIHGGWTDTQEVEGGKLSEDFNLNFEVAAIYESLFGLDLNEREEYYRGIHFDLQKQIIWAEFNPIYNLLVNFEYANADAIDFSQARQGKTDTFDLTLEYQVTRQLSSELEFINQIFDLPQGELYEAEVANLKLGYQINLKNFLRLTVQSQRFKYGLDVADEVKFMGTQLIYSYKVNPFTLAYIGYSDNAENDPNTLQLRKTDRTWFIKFSYAWQT
ncbi:carbohydrate binding family 9 domain-containing protein [Aliikangiella coralliicola]|uniref:Carbohydrate binding family 9 domain-containing protein n=1 Tax=Aliikangiella coralliicola TaxID=2592383 RepID=A0A545U4T9_9GAMM|nr:carbohydrate binding family 9 domain-containing protein [Aliikangiella coralliicola]TQV84490.1 carbohydrate binding family 9 domain-containing protein [Aliikangiella coralliicola]